MCDVRVFGVCIISTHHTGPTIGHHFSDKWDNRWMNNGLIVFNIGSRDFYPIVGEQKWNLSQNRISHDWTFEHWAQCKLQTFISLFFSYSFSWYTDEYILNWTRRISVKYILAPLWYVIRGVYCLHIVLRCMIFRTVIKPKLVYYKRVTNSLIQIVMSIQT